MITFSYKFVSIHIIKGDTHHKRHQNCLKSSERRPHPTVADDDKHSLEEIHDLDLKNGGGGYSLVVQRLRLKSFQCWWGPVQTLGSELISHKPP